MPPLAATWNIATQDVWPLLLVPIALALALLGTRRTTPPVRSARRFILVALRTLAYTLLLVVLASPVVNRLRHIPQRARVAVLIDESASMSSADAPDGPSRYARAREVLRGIRDGLRGEPVDLDVVPFADGARAAVTPAEYLASADSAGGAGTDVLEALRATADRMSGDNLQALVLVSDGRATRGALDPGGAAALGRPVYAVGLGDTLPPADLALGRVDYNPVAYVESETEIAVRVEASGFRGRGTTLRLLHDGREIFSRRLAFDQDRGRTSVRIPVALRTPGRQNLQLVLDPLPGELTERNNRREIRIEVLKSRIRVLALAPRPNWDIAFLARTLRDDPNVQLTLLDRNADNTWIESDTGKPYPLPRGAAWARDVDLIVVAGAMRELGATAAGEIERAVEAGKGLLALATSEGLPDGASWDAVLPVVRGRQRGPRYGVLSVRLAPQGRTHPATSSLLGIASTDGGLGSFAPILGAVNVTLKPASLTLLAIETDSTEPFLIVGRHGEGQTAVVTGFPFWRWGLVDREPVRNATIAFVGSLVRYLVQPRDVEPVHLAVPKTVFESGEGIEITAQVLDSQFAPLDDAELRVDLHRTDAGGEAAATLVLQNRAGRPGEYSGTLPGPGPGEYEAVAEATRGGRVLGRASVRFTVDAYSAEFADTRQDADFLREIASRTGGAYSSPDRVAALAQSLPKMPREIELQSELEVWNTTPLFVLFVIVLGSEWLLRKRYGLL